MALKNIPLDPNRKGEQATALEEGLRQRIVGQDEAIRQVVDLYQIFLSGLKYHNRPIGNPLFLGPTGSGKTRLVEVMAELLMGTPRAVVKIDCSELQHSHEISKLVGSPPGYLGHRDTKAILSQQTLDQYHTEQVKVSLVLFDEIEKASDALWNLLLGITDKATLTLGNNECTDFSRAMIFMTSNLGAVEMTAHISPRIGFDIGRRIENMTEVPTGVVSKMMISAQEAARRKFSPEFMNRLDGIVVFKPLGERELERVLDIELIRTQKHILENSKTPFIFEVTGRAKKVILQEGTDMRYGARNLNRAIQRLVIHPLSNLQVSRQLNIGDMVQIDISDEQFSFTKMGSTLSMDKMFEKAYSTRAAIA